MLKRAVKEKGIPPTWGMETQFPHRKALIVIKQSSLFYEGMSLPDAVQSKYNFYQWCMSWNGLEWAQKSFNKPKSA